jgi:hypothetical protein
MRIIEDSANMGEDVAILAEEEASDEVVFNEEGNVVEPEETSEDLEQIDES